VAASGVTEIIDMQDLQLQVPATDEVEVDGATLSAIDAGMKASTKLASGRWTRPGR
jgi:hypothetical protein